MKKVIPFVKELRFTPEEVILSKNIADNCSVYLIEKGSVE